MVKRPVAKFAVLALAGVSGFTATAAYAVCNGPAELLAKIKAHPTTDNAVVLGSWYASHKQFDCAVATFRAAVKSDSGSAQLHYLTGLAYVDGNHTADALPELQKAVQLDPQVIKPHLMLAFVLDQEGKRQEAEEQWHQALAIDPASTTALEGLSQDLLDRNAFIDVVILLRNAPHTEKLTIDLARALGNLNMLDDARDVLTEALSARPASLPLSRALIVVLVKQLRYQDAINLAQHIVEANPGNQEAELQLFRILVLTNHINAARPIGPKLLAKRPHDAEVLYLNGIVLRALGDYPGAKSLLEQSVSIDPSLPNSHYELGMVLVFLKDWAPARQELEKSIAMGAKEAQAHYQLALALRGLGESEQAKKEIQIYQEQKSSDESQLEASMKAAQADDELKNDKLQDALSHYKEAVAAQPSNANFKYKLALALHKAGDSNSERAQLEQAIQLDPNLAGAQNELGYLLSRSGDSAGALQHFQAAVHAAPSYLDAWINLAAEFAIAGQFPEARDAIAMALRLDPENEQAKKLNDRLSRESAAHQSQP
ncbi:tetratricopeptide repeat protein [Telmatobacter sp. DSM 110680]|uniref:Tetratricopeptide repeat protein n=1 Tax=Telmatobacter sp. DSM 110680 TaxID=3036704 RepID=A0AAU7DRY6_9BACT